MYIFDFIQGFIIGLSLIIAIGPQNLFVIRQGLRKSFIFMGKGCGTKGRKDC